MRLRIIITWILLLLIPIFLPSQAFAADSSRCPTSEVRSKIEEVWNANKPTLLKNITNRLNKSDPYILYDTQTHTNNLLNMTDYCEDISTLQQLVDLYLIAYPYLVLHNNYRQWLCNSTACSAYEGQPIEYVLPSAQFVYILARTANIITSLPQSKVSPTMTDFLHKYTSVITHDHLHRWIKDTTIFSRKGYGCVDKGNYNHSDYLSKLLNRSFGNSPTYCNIVTDRDLWIIAASAEILMADNNSNIVTLSPEEKEELKEHVRLGIRLVQSRLTETSLTNFTGERVTGYDFDQGMWKDYPDNAYAGYTNTTYPTVENKLKNDLSGWDISHARRYVHVFHSLNAAKNLVEYTFPDDSDVLKLANQMAYGIFNKDLEFPLFSNYWNGINGWYRVGYSNRAGYGFGPSDHSLAFATGGYGFWGKYNPDIDKISVSVWRIIEGATSETAAFRQNHYGSVYINYEKTNSTTLNQPNSIELLQILPSLLSFNPIPTISATQKPGDANNDSKVDGLDYIIWLNAYGKSGEETHNPDFNNDTKVDGLDYVIWLTNYNK